jgi:cob(I)alamin adenosyltransferase
MIRLAEIVSRYAPALIEQYGHELLPGQRKALSAFQMCRSAARRARWRCCTRTTGASISTRMRIW